MKDVILKILTESMLFNVDSNIKYDKLVNKQNIRLQISNHYDITIDNELMLSKIIIDELIKETYKYIKSYIINENNVYYYDFLKNNIENIEEYNRFSSLIGTIDNKKCIIGGRFNSLIKQTLYYIPCEFVNVNSHLPYRSTTINNIEIFVDSYFGWYDNSIISFDDILINTDNVELVDNNRVVYVNFEFEFIIKNPKVYYIIESEKSNGYKDFIKNVRKDRIKGIVEELKGI